MIKAISIYTESTPNPETLKFVANKLLYPTKSIEITREKNASVSPLAEALFAFPFVQSVFIASNFVTITKTKETDWEGVKAELKQLIQQFLIDGNAVILEDRLEQTSEMAAPKSSDEIVHKIEEILENYVKPAVEMDGGAIHLKKYEDGKVYVTLQGACSGCPSSTITLKAGIETMMKRMIPEVKEVIAD